MRVHALQETHRANVLADRASLARLARTMRHRALVREAETAIHEFLMVTTQPYLALSGGKDSAATLALAAPIAASLDVSLPACWSDDELEHECQEPYMRALCAQFATPFMIVTARDSHAGWFRTWSDPSFWRPRPAGALDFPNTDCGRGMRVRGFDGVMLGLRAEESSYRRINAAVRGRVYQRATTDWVSQPLARWRVEDVWALLLDRTVPTNPIYDRLAAIGVPLERQRVGPIPLDDGGTLRAGWPDLWHRLVARYGEKW